MLWIKSLPTRCCAFVSVLAMFFACTPEENNTSGTDEPGGAVDKTIHVIGISLNPTAITIKEGESATITATVTPDNADNKAYSWSSSNDQVASVSDGKVIGIKAGSATIIVATEDGGKTATCSVTVEQNLAPSVTVGADHISAISALLQGKANLGNSASSDLKVGFQYSKSAGILPSNSTTIEATDADASYNYTASITGLEPDTKYYFRSFVRQNGQDTYGETKEFTTKDVASLLETKEASGVEATKATLNAKLDLTDVLYTSLAYGFLWGTSESTLNTNFKCLEIKDNAIAATLTSLSHKTRYWYKAYVTLGNHIFYGEVKTFTTDVVKVESVSLDKTEYTFNTIGNTLTLKATVLPADATNNSVEWSSDNESVATVDNNGRVTSKGNGKAVITVKTKDQEKTATCEVTVSVPVSSISLNKTSLTLIEGEEETLVVTINPSNAADKIIKWTSSDTSVAAVDENGKVTAVSKGTATIKAEVNDGSGKYATCSVNVYRVEPLVAVDLGLSIKWANENIGARWPEDYGDYYAWGEVEPYYSSQDPLTWKDGKTAGYNWASYKWCNGYKNKLTKYCPTNKTSYWDGEGSPDGKTVLEPEDDAAHVSLGGKWRMPTDEEWTELRTKCAWTWTTQNGVNGRLVTGPNGNCIFLPATGCRFDTFLSYVGSSGYYWSSSLYTYDPYSAWSVNLYSGYVSRESGYYRCDGFSVRPVTE